MVQLSGGNFDIVLDDGGHTYQQQLTSFQALWPSVASGGLYVIEDLQVSDSQSKMVRHILGWVDQLATNKIGQRNSSWVEWPSKTPDKILFVHCEREICAFKKS